MGWLVTLFSDRLLLLLSFAIWVQHTKVPNLGVVSGFSDSQLLLLSVLHNTATEQNTETLVFAVGYRKPKPQQQFLLRYYRNRTALKKMLYQG